jgi:adenylate cyclase
VVGVGSWHPSRCEQLLLEALERDSNHVRSLLALGWLRRLQDQHLESRIMLEKAIALDPNLTPAMVQLGFTLLYLGDPKAALRHFQKAIALSPRDPNQHWFHNGLGICHL